MQGMWKDSSPCLLKPVPPQQGANSTGIEPVVAHAPEAMGGSGGSIVRHTVWLTHCV